MIARAVPTQSRQMVNDMREICLVIILLVGAVAIFLVMTDINQLDKDDDDENRKR